MGRGPKWKQDLDSASTNTDRCTDRAGLWLLRGKEEGEGGSEFGIRGCKLVHIGWVSNEVLL